MKKSHRAVVVLLVCFSFLFMAVTFASRIVIPHALEARCRDLFGVPVKIDKAGLNFLNGSLWVKGFEMENPPQSENEKFFSFRSLTVDLSFTSLLARQLIFEQIRFEEPTVNIERRANGELNIHHFERTFGDRFKPRIKLGRQFFFVGYEIRRFSIKRGVLRFFSDTSHNAPKRRSIRDIDLSFSFFAYPPSLVDPTPTSFYLSAKADGIREASLQILGKGSFLSAKRNFHARGDLKNIPARDLNAAFPEFPFLFTDGFADVKSELNSMNDRFRMTGKINVAGLKIADKVSFAKKKTAFGHPRKDILDLFEAAGGRPFDFDFELEGDFNDPVMGLKEVLREKIFVSIETELNKVLERFKGKTLAVTQPERLIVQNVEAGIHRTIEQWFGAKKK